METNLPVRSDLIRRLRALHERRLSCLQDLSATIGDLLSIDCALKQQVTALRWSASTDPSTGESDVWRPIIEDDVVSAIIALLHLGTPSTISRSLELISELSVDDSNADIVADALRWTDLGAVDDAIDVLLKTDSLAPELRASMLGVRLRKKGLSPGAVCDSLQEADDMVVNATARTIVWLAPTVREHANVWVDRAQDLLMNQPALASALLLAAVAMGAKAATDIVRARIAKGDIDELLIDALAVSGDRRDVEELLRIAEASRPHGVRALLAAAHLGSTGSIQAIEGKRVTFGDEIVNVAIRAIVGDAMKRPEPSGDVRWACGSPWSVVGAINRLKSTTEHCCFWYWVALELVVRVGTVVPTPGDLSAPTERLAGLIENLELTLRSKRAPHAAR